MSDQTQPRPGTMRGKSVNDTIRNGREGDGTQSALARTTGTSTGTPRKASGPEPRARGSEPGPLTRRGTGLVETAKSAPVTDASAGRVNKL